MHPRVSRSLMLAGIVLGLLGWKRTRRAAIARNTPRTNPRRPSRISSTTSPGSVTTFTYAGDGTLIAVARPAATASPSDASWTQGSGAETKAAELGSPASES